MPEAEKAKRLFEDGKVREATSVLMAYLRDHPSDTKQRTFLFELLCFSGEYDRAEKQLSVLAQGNQETEMGAVLYYSVLHAEKIRHETLLKQEFSKASPSGSFSGILNGREFRSLRDADPDLGARLEVFAAGACLWVPFEHIESLVVQPPRRLRDTLWTTAMLRTGPAFKGMELGEVIIPAVYPFSWKHPNEAVWLGRLTDWAADEHGVAYPSGQRVFQMDDEEVTFLDIRSLEFHSPERITQATTN